METFTCTMTYLYLLTRLDLGWAIWWGSLSVKTLILHVEEIKGKVQVFKLVTSFAHHCQSAL